MDDSDNLPAPSNGTTDPFADLTNDQQKTLEVFKDNLVKAGLYRRSDSEDGSASHDDVTLLFVSLVLRPSHLLPYPCTQEIPPCKRLRSHRCTKTVLCDRAVAEEE